MAACAQLLLKTAVYTVRAEPPFSPVFHTPALHAKLAYSSAGRNSKSLCTVHMCMYDLGRPKSIDFRSLRPTQHARTAAGQDARLLRLIDPLSMTPFLHVTMGESAG